MGQDDGSSKGTYNSEGSEPTATGPSGLRENAGEKESL